ncbi:MAG TPA: RibD family protein [Polyangiaceae bacterium]|jgi:riboflavin-specific deaminase-like protein|nr:RibD family protein [Polyangiaceae bacterium]
MQLLAYVGVGLDEARAWGLLRELARRASAGLPVSERTGFVVDAAGRIEEVAAEHAQIVIEPGAEPCFQSATRLAPAVVEMLELYLPLCIGKGARELVIGHVGQSLDGQIATASGSSRYVTGPENIVHMHRLRSLVDAVLVGAGTVECDDPELTTRLVPGKHPTRVVVDPSLRLQHTRKLYRDGVAPTLIVCARGSAKRGGPPRVPLLEVAAENSLLSVTDLLSALAARGLRRVFVEGGGVTISHFIQARKLDRLHVTICPMIIGRGRPGISLPGVESLDEALRPSTRRFLLGADVLFDCRLRS